MLTTDQKGAVAEAAIAAVALAHGVGVARPLSDEKYDLIFDLGQRLLRVQCKWSIRAGNVIVIRTRRARRSASGFVHRRYAADEIDAVAAYCQAVDQCYLLPTELSVERAVVQLRLPPCRNNQLLGVHWARDFELGATLNRLRGPIAQLGERLDGIQKAAGSSPAGSMNVPAT
jgi:hypothetical protein